MNRVSQTSLALVTILALPACGQVGELYLPKPIKTDSPTEITGDAQSNSELDTPSSESSSSKPRQEK